MRAYFEIDGEKYYGYEIILRVKNAYLSHYGNVFLDINTWKNLYDITAGDKVSIPHGASVYVAPGCPIPHDDIRRNYKIKRDVDSGDFNVVNDLSYNRKCRVKITDIDKASKTVIISDIVYSGPDGNCVYIFNMPELYEDILMGKLTKPIASYRQLEIKNTNCLTIDTLSLIYRLSMKYPYSEDIDKYKLQLKALSQTDWRDYPYTISTVLKVLPINKYCCGHILCKKKSERDKAIDIMYKCSCSYDKASQKDRDMLYDLMCEILDIKGEMFVSLNDFMSKIQSRSIPWTNFLDVFDCTVRIRKRNNA